VPPIVRRPLTFLGVGVGVGIRAWALRASIVGTEARAPLIVPAAIVIATVGVRAPAPLLSIVGAEARAPLIVPAAIVIATVGVRAPALLLSIVGAEARAPLIVPAAIVIATVGVRLRAILLPRVGAEALARLNIRPALTPRGVAAPPILFSLLGSEVSARSIIRLAITAADVDVIAVPALSIIEAGVLPPGIVRVAIETGGGGELAILLISRLNHAVEPFADRQAGSPSGGACSLARFRTKASQIPRTARFHAHVQIT